jgi:hypothetical protein
MAWIFYSRNLTITNGTSSFITKFASSSDLGILSASLLGPLLYMMFREEGQPTGDRVVSRFPSGLWFVMIIVACCIVATVIYSFTYVSSINAFYSKDGLPVQFANANNIALTSWILLGFVTLIILLASTIRNSLDAEAPRIMRADTQNYVKAFEAAQSAPSDTQDFTNQLAAAQGKTK